MSARTNKSAQKATKDLERSFAEDKRRSCLSKRLYRSEADAEMQAGMEARRTGKEFRAYQCRWCRRWHLASH